MTRVCRCADLLSEFEFVLNYVADMTYIGKDGEWHFKPGYDPQRVLDVLALLRVNSRR